jgi:hypothetical protein
MRHPLFHHLFPGKLRHGIQGVLAPSLVIGNRDLPAYPKSGDPRANQSPETYFHVLWALPEHGDDRGPSFSNNIDFSSTSL